jgi:tRNA dimethylallyltransferase
LIAALLWMGPTASGKSALALALSERFRFEIVSVDSAQVYRGMDIGTAKPDAATRARIPHHLIDLIDPTESYSVARFRADALAAVAAIRARGRIPLLVGGTMLYFKALLEGLSVLPPADPQVRARLEARARQVGWPRCARNSRCRSGNGGADKATDPQRIQRAQVWWRPAARKFRVRVSDALGPTWRLHCYRRIARLHTAIAHRFDAMLAGRLPGIARLRGAMRSGVPSMRCASDIAPGNFRWRYRPTHCAHEGGRHPPARASTAQVAVDPGTPSIPWPLHFDAVASLLSASGYAGLASLAAVQ